MHLKILINKGIDGYTATIPSIKGCEAWSENPDTALEKIIDLLKYYLKAEKTFKYKIDQNLNSAEKKIFTIVFEKH